MKEQKAKVRWSKVSTQPHEVTGKYYASEADGTLYESDNGYEWTKINTDPQATITTVSLQITNIDGEVIKEKILELTEGSTLIAKIPSIYSTQNVEEIFDALASIGDSKAIAIPDDIELQIITIKNSNYNRS
jgi:hypothetical protein